MSEYFPHDISAPIDIADAYRIVWGAGTIALNQKHLETDVKDTHADELMYMFERLDKVRDEATIAKPTDSVSDQSQLTFYTLIEPFVKEINSLKQAHHSASNPAVDSMKLSSRLPALTSLVLNLETSKNSLHESKSPSLES